MSEHGITNCWIGTNDSSWVNVHNNHGCGPDCDGSWEERNDGPWNRPFARHTRWEARWYQMTGMLWNTAYGKPPYTEPVR